ncbi:hypothetical protein EXIGLDRAFT_779158 [Exidia glandulosa HHB12029]|uniref:Uncharacterized protein n=1 Tax=Exidia glandulosa HHB12029 TaxID=1314781 RepID=A0A165C729_EXIGL|nr:hypothetical protein EXIGLDRAFT_779158 [Exidia glandulosa HHB12029]
MVHPVWTTAEQRQFLESHRAAWRTATEAGKDATKTFFAGLYGPWFEQWPSSSEPFDRPKGGRRNEVEVRQQAIRTWYTRYGHLDGSNTSASSRSNKQTGKKQVKTELHRQQALNATGATGDDAEVSNSAVLAALATPTVTFRPPKLLIGKKLSTAQIFSTLYHGQELKTRVEEEFAREQKEYQSKLDADPCCDAKKPTKIATNNRVTAQRWSEIEAEITSNVASEATQAIHEAVTRAVKDHGDGGTKTSELLQAYAIDNAGALTDDVARGVKAMFPESFCCSVFVAGKTESGMHVFHAHFGANEKGQGLAHAQEELVAAFGQGMATFALERATHLKRGKGKKKQPQTSTPASSPPVGQALDAPAPPTPRHAPAPPTPDQAPTLPYQPPTPTPSAPSPSPEHRTPIHVTEADSPRGDGDVEDTADLQGSSRSSTPTPPSEALTPLSPTSHSPLKDSDRSVGLLNIHGRPFKLRAQLPRRVPDNSPDSREESPTQLLAPGARVTLDSEAVPLLSHNVDQVDEDTEESTRPDWLSAEHVARLSGELGLHGRPLLDAFLAGEARAIDGKLPRFSAIKRPTQVADWVRDMRRLTYKPTGTDTQKYRDSVVAWYTASCGARSIGSRERVLSLEAMQRTGLNGVYSLVTAIAWWIAHGGIDAKSSDGHSARVLVDDLTWILTQPVSHTDTDPALSSTHKACAEPANTPKVTTSKPVASSSRSTRASAAAMEASSGVKTRTAQKRTMTDAQLEGPSAPKRVKASSASSRVLRHTRSALVCTTSLVPVSLFAALSAAYAPPPRHSTHPSTPRVTDS